MDDGVSGAAEGRVARRPLVESIAGGVGAGFLAHVGIVGTAGRTSARQTPSREERETVDNDLRTLLDRAAIEAVRHRFALALDTRDWALSGSLFTDEVDADLAAVGSPRRTQPKADLVALFRHAFRRPAAENPTQQLYGNLPIEVTGDTATCSSYLVGHHTIPDFAGGDEATLRARYVDRLTRTSDGWKIAALTLHVFSITGNAAILA